MATMTLREVESGANTCDGDNIIGQFDPLAGYIVNIDNMRPTEYPMLSGTTNYPGIRYLSIR